MMQVLMPTLRKYLSEWQVIVVSQEYDIADGAFVQSNLPKAKILNFAQRLGPHNAKLKGLDLILDIEKDNEFVVCSIDDDMEFVEQTNFEQCLHKVLQNGTGLVSANWANHRNSLKNKKIKDEFVSQPIVYTGGGLLFSSKIAKIIAAIPEGDYFCDNSEWSLAVYLAGYTNYRYKGSLTIHRICSKGGRRAWVLLSDKKIPNEQFLKIKKGNLTNRINNFLVGDSSDLTLAAKEMHKQNKKQL